MNRQVNRDVITVQDLIDLYEKKGTTVVLSNGRVTCARIGGKYETI